MVNELIDLDILADRDGGLWFVDPVLPVLIALDRVRCETASDPQGLFSGAAGSVEIDAVAAGTEVWVVEAKHRAGGITGSMVDRFRRAADAYRQITGIPIDHRWYVSRSGFRAEGRARCDAAGIYFSTAGDLAQLERALGE